VDGKVCLSLLGTWDGKESCENWNAASSSVQQVLLSFLGLVLVSEPYYNEAGYMSQVGTREGHHNSVMYNESALLLSIAHITRMLKSTPSYCKELVKNHYLARGQAMVQRLESYFASDYTHACTNSSSCDDNGVMQKPSHGFLLTLKNRLEKLKAALKALQQ